MSDSDLADHLERLAARLDAPPPAPASSRSLRTPPFRSAARPTSCSTRRPPTLLRMPCSPRARPVYPTSCSASVPTSSIGDRGFRGLVIRNTARAHEFREQGDDCQLWTESGAVVKDLIQESVARGWSGLEHYVGIPSTVGGAVWQNLHFLSPAPERERTMFIAEVFESCEILSEENERKTVGADYVQLRLRRHGVPSPARHRSRRRRSVWRAATRRRCTAFCRRI